MGWIKFGGDWWDDYYWLSMGCLKLSTFLLGVSCIIFLLHRYQQGSSREPQCLNVPFNKNIHGALEIALLELSLYSNICYSEGGLVWFCLFKNQSMYVYIPWKRIKSSWLFIDLSHNTVPYVSITSEHRGGEYNIQHKWVFKNTWDSAYPGLGPRSNSSS